MRLRYLRSAWKKGSWMWRLSGLILSPLMLENGVEQWIASLRDSRANHTASPEPEKVPMMNDGSGPLSLGLFATLEHGSWFSRTCQAYLVPEDSKKYCETWPKWGSLRNGDALRRPVSAPAIGANVFLLWPMTRANDAEKRGEIANNPRNGIVAVAQNWATPTAANVNEGETLKSWEMRRQKILALHINGNGMGMPLALQASTCPTPRTRANLGDSGSAQRQSRGLNLGLNDAAANWPTPRMTDGDKGGPNQSGSKGDLMLTSATANWPSPTARIVKGGGRRSDAQKRTKPERYAGLGSGRFFAPGPSSEEWPEIITKSPQLAPALEPGVCLLVDGAAMVVDKYRNHQLRLGGNGVVPLQAATAIARLMHRLGFRAMNTEAA